MPSLPRGSLPLSDDRRNRESSNSHCGLPLLPETPSRAHSTNGIPVGTRRSCARRTPWSAGEGRARRGTTSRWNYEPLCIPARSALACQAVASRRRLVRASPWKRRDESVRFPVRGAHASSPAARPYGGRPSLTISIRSPGSIGKSKSLSRSIMRSGKRLLCRLSSLP